MTFKKSSRAGLLALAFGALLGIVLSWRRQHLLRAGAGRRRPPPRPLRRRQPAAPPPACAADPDPKKAVLEKCTPNSGDTAWMLTSVALVLMMTIPGLGLFYGGMVRKKNVGDTVMTSFAVTCLVTILCVVVHLQPGLHRRRAIHRRAQSRVPARHPERHLERHRQSESAGGDDPRDRLHLLPDDLRDHHAGADRRRLRRAHEVLGDAVVHRPVGDLRLCADRALGLGAGRLPVHRQLRRHGQGARLRRRHRRAHQRRRRRPDVRDLPRQAQGHRPRRTTWC